MRSRGIVEAPALMVGAGAVGEATVDVRFDDGQIDGQVGGLGRKITRSLGGAGKAAGLALGAGIGVAGIAIVKAVGDASDLEESISKATRTFEGSAPAVQKWSKTTAESLGLSRAAALEGASSIGAMLKPMGIAPKAAADMSLGVTQLAADMASFNNEDPTDMLDRIRAGLSGESEPLKRYGTVLSEARVQQFAWASGLAKTGEQLTDQQKIQARYGLLMKDTADQQGDFARTSEGLANQQRILKAELANASAELGAAFLPAAVAVVGVLRDLLPHAVAFGQAIVTNVGPPLREVAEVVQANWPPVRDVIVGVVDTIRGALGLFSGDARTKSAEVQTAVSDVRTVFETVFRAIAAVVQVAAGVYQQIATGIRAHSAEIKATVESIRAIFVAVWPAISRVVEVAFGIIRTTVDTTLRVIGNLIRAVMAAIRGDWSQVWSSLGDAVRVALTGALSIIRQLLGAAIPAALGLAKTIGLAILRGLLNGLASLAASLAQQLAAIPRALTTAAAGVPGVAAGIGRSIVTGILSGLGGLFGMLKDRLESTLRGVLSSLSPFSPVEEGGAKHIGRPIAAGAIRGWIEGSADLPNTIAEGVRRAVDVGREAVEASRGTMSAAWGQLGNDLGAAFDAAWSKPTKAEQQLERLEKAATEGRLVRAIDDARAALATAQTPDEGEEIDAAKVVAAQRQLDEALQAQVIYGLQQRAAIERREAEAAVALKRRHFEAELAELQAQLARRGATEGQAQQAVLALMQRYGIRYKQVAGQLGKSFVIGLRESLAGAVREAEDVADAIEAALGRVKSANARVGRKTGGGPAGLVAPVSTGLGPLGAAVTGPGPLAAGAGGGGSLYGRQSPTRLLGAALARSLRTAELGGGDVSLDGLAVIVKIGDTELRGIVSHEVKRHDAGVARELMAGAA